MIYKNLNIHYKIINIWFGFILFLVAISNLPHAGKIPLLSWLNSSIYFLLFLQSAYIFKQDSKNKTIFLNIGIFALFHSLSFAYLLIGDHYLIGSNYLTWYIFEYQELLLIFVFAFSIIFICVKYYFNNLSSPYIYLITLLAMLPIFVWQFYPYLVDKNFILDNSLNENMFYKGLLYFNFLPLFFVIFYGILLYKYDRSLGEHINTVMVCFFIMLLMDITNLLGDLYAITIFSMTQYFLLLILSFFLITLFKRLNYVYSDFGQFYDNLVISGNNMGVPIKRKKSTYATLIDFAKSYFYTRRNALFFITLVLVFCINYFNVSPFLKLNLSAISFCILVLFFYLTALYQKRIQKGRLLAISRNNKSTN